SDLRRDRRPRARQRARVCQPGRRRACGEPVSGSTPEKEKKKSGIVLILFGAAFLLPGLCIMVFGPLDTLYQHVRSSDWVQVPATLESVSLNSHRGDDGYTYSVSASYRYRVNGRSYTNTRVGYDTGSDNIGDYHDDLVWRL